MEVQRWRDGRLNEELVVARWPTGLEAFVLPKAGFSKKYAVFSTRFGSTDFRFRHPGTGQVIEPPAGVAHFLEHKLFEEEEGNAFDRFAALGASANAYTSYGMTSYLFSCSEHFEENFDILLDYVQEPYFTDENVEKEKGIIEQEIRMYQDHASYRIMRNLLDCLYHRHPVKVDILGTVESIRRIDKGILYTLHETFYHPGNMAIFVVGEVDPEAVFRQVEQDMAPRGYGPRPPVWREAVEEPDTVREARVVDSLNVSRPRYAIGFKDRVEGLEGRALLERELVSELVLSMVFGRSTDFYQRLYEAGLIDDGFGGHYSMGRGFGYSVVGGETHDPDRLHEEVCKEVERVRAEGLRKEDIRRLQRRDIGTFLQLFNSLEFIANGFLQYHFMGTSLLDYLDVLEGIGEDMVQQRLLDHLQLERSAVSIILPTRQRVA